MLSVAESPCRRQVWPINRALFSAAVGAENQAAHITSDCPGKNVMGTGKNIAMLRAARVVPVLRLASRQAAETAIDCLVEAGFTTVEVTLTTPGAIDLIKSLRREKDADFLVGAGTVLDLDSARACLDAGADYLVSPCLVPGLAALAEKAEVGSARASLSASLAVRSRRSAHGQAFRFSARHRARRFLL